MKHRTTRTHRTTTTTTTAVVLAVIGLASGRAYAQIGPSIEQPAMESTIAATPAEVTLEFDGKVDPKRSGFVVLDPKGRSVGVDHVKQSPTAANLFSIGLPTKLPPATYTVAWHSVDRKNGKPKKGSYHFTISH